MRLDVKSLTDLSKAVRSNNNYVNNYIQFILFNIDNAVL